MIIFSSILYLMTFVNKLSLDLSMIINNRNSKNVLGINVEEGYEIPTRAYYDLITNHYRKLSVLTIRLKKDFHNILRVYQGILKCDDQRVTSKPKYTHIFKNIVHYRKIYLLINEFLEIKKYDFKSNNMLVRVEKLNKVFEYYCLLKLLRSMKSLGYELKESSKIYQGKINDYYILTDTMNQFTIELFYEPLIYSDPKRNNMFNLYRAGKKNNYLTPDYLIALRNNNSNKVVYGILDAKYSSINTVRDHYMSKCMDKYLHDLTVYKSQINSVVFLDFLCASNGHFKDNNYDYHENRRSHLGSIIPSINIVNCSPVVIRKDIDGYVKERLDLLYQQLGSRSVEVERNMKIVDIV